MMSWSRGAFGFKLKTPSNELQLVLYWRTMLLVLSWMRTSNCHLRVFILPSLCRPSPHHRYPFSSFSPLPPPPLPSPPAWLLQHSARSDGLLNNKNYVVNKSPVTTPLAAVKNENCFVTGSLSAISSSDSLRENKPSSSKVFVLSASWACTKDLPFSPQRNMAAGYLDAKSFMHCGASSMTWCGIRKEVSAGMHSWMISNHVEFFHISQQLFRVQYNSWFLMSCFNKSFFPGVSSLPVLMGYLIRNWIIVITHHTCKQLESVL